MKQLPLAPMLVTLSIIFFKDVDIPYGTSLVLTDNVGFNKSMFHLRIVTQNASDGGAPSLTVIIK